RSLGSRPSARRRSSRSARGGSCGTPPVSCSASCGPRRPAFPATPPPGTERAPDRVRPWAVSADLGVAGLAAVAVPATVLSQREDVAAVVGDDQRVLELGGAAAVGGDRSP